MPLDEGEQASLRERKKRRTRAELVEVSQRLFATQGYEATSLDDICAEVAVSPQTLLRYFVSKADLAMAPEENAFVSLRERISDPTRSEPALSVWRAHVEHHAAAGRTSIAARRRWQMPEAVLVAKLAQLDVFYEAVLAEQLARDADIDLDEDPTPLLLAAALVAGNAAMFRRWLCGGGDVTTLKSRMVQVIDVTLAHFPTFLSDADADADAGRIEIR